MTLIEQPTIQLDLTLRGTITDAGWYDDPHASHALRYHDGNRWTEHVTHYGPTPCNRCN